jgi:small GTP-binding protein
MTTGEDQLIKVMLLGDSTVGKTSLLTVLSGKPFPENFMTTVGVSCITSYFDVGTQKVRLQIWDTAGQERFRSIPRTYFVHSDGFILVYDVTLLDSFTNMSNWVTTTRNQSSSTIKLIIGNKADLETERRVPKDKGEELAARLGARFFETSALSGYNVKEAFNCVAELLLIEKGQEITQSETPAVQRSVTLEAKKKKSRCPC